MTITVAVTIGYRVPDECSHAEQFQIEHPDWSVSDTTNYIYFKKETFYEAGIKEDE